MNLNLIVAAVTKILTVTFCIRDGEEIRGLEQNPDMGSRWAQMACSGKKVMQFLSEGRYVANVVNGKIHRYGNQAREGETTHHTA